MVTSQDKIGLILTVGRNQSDTVGCGAVPREGKSHRCLSFRSRDWTFPLNIETDLSLVMLHIKKRFDSFPVLIAWV